MKYKTGNQKLVRLTNQRLIIDLIRSKGLISRAELAKTIKLSAPSVSSIIESLLELDIIKEVGSGDLMGSGRPPILLEFNRDFGYIICIDLATEDICIALGDLQGTIISEQHIFISLEKKIKKEIFNQIMDCIEGMLIQQKIPESRLKVICVGTPGIINKETGFFQMAPRFENWDKLNIQQLMEEKFKAKIIIMNDANLALIGENRYGAGISFRNLISLNIDVGIGAAIILNGSLYEGSRFAAGEIGYWISGLPQVNSEGQATWQHLDSVISLHSLKSKIQNMDNFLRGLEQNDPYYIEILNEMIKHLASAIANIIILLDVELIILAGEVNKLGTWFLDPLNKLVNQLVPLPTTIRNAELANRAGIYGGFSIASDYVMSTILEEV